MKLCIVIALIIIILLIINIHKYDLFIDFTSSNNYVLSGGIKNGLEFNDNTMRNIIDTERGGNPSTIRQSQLFSCKNKKAAYHSASLSAKKYVKDWFKKGDKKIGDETKIQCPMNDKYIPIDTICKRDDWYKNCDNLEASDENSGGKKFCKYLCGLGESDHHLRTPFVSYMDRHEQTATYEEGTVDRCRYVDTSNGRPWFSEKRGKDANEIRKCPGKAEVYVPVEKICQPKSSSGLFMDWENDGKFMCSFINSYDMRDWSDDGSDELCCPKLRVQNSMGTRPEGIWSGPILHQKFCETIWKGNGGNSDWPDPSLQAGTDAQCNQMPEDRPPSIWGCDAGAGGE